MGIELDPRIAAEILHCHQQTQLTFLRTDPHCRRCGRQISLEQSIAALSAPHIGIVTSNLLINVGMLFNYSYRPAKVQCPDIVADHI